MDDTGYHNVAPDGTRTDLTPPLIGRASAEMWHQQLAAHPGYSPYTMLVDGHFQDIVWIPDNTTPNIVNSPPPIDNTLPSGNGGSHDPRQVALDVLAHIPLPDIKLKMNPSLGLVALSSWYWVSGYNGSDISQSRTVTFPAPNPLDPPTSFTVSVRIWPSRYTWDFGDGTSIDSHSLGEPYPTQSDVQHTYQFSSHGHQGGFPVRLTVEFAAEYRVNGGGPQGLPAIRHTYETDYPVQELQPVLTRQ